MIDGTLLCLTVSRRFDATSLPGSRGTLWAAISSLSFAHPSGCLVRLSGCCARVTVTPVTRCSQSGAAPRAAPKVAFLRADSHRLVLAFSFQLFSFFSADGPFL